MKKVMVVMDKINNQLFENCISLGWFCGTASALSFYGLRNFSGPFDWYFSDFEPVLKMMESDFKDFLKKENLEPNDGGAKFFHDKKYGFDYRHDVVEDFEKEYDKIFNKYKRRIEYFREAIKKPTCFFRTVRSEEEIRYIEENKEYIYSVIKKENNENDIIFVVRNGIGELTDELWWYRIDIDNYQYDGYGMVTTFVENEKLIECCENRMISNDKKTENLAHESTNLVRDICINEWLEKNVDEMEKTINELKNNNELYVWGAGVYGEKIVKYMLGRNMDVKAIIDSDRDKIGKKYLGLPIVSPDNVSKKFNVNILVSVIAKKVVDEIVCKINEILKECNIIVIDDIYNKMKRNRIKNEKDSCIGNYTDL